MRGYRSEDRNYTSSCEALDTLSDCLITLSKADYKVRRDSVSAEDIHCAIERIKDCREREIRTEAAEKLRIHSFNIVFYLACPYGVKLF